MAVSVDKELVLCIDISGSVSDEEFLVMRNGYTAALRNSAFQASVLNGTHGKIAITLVYFATNAATYIGWSLLEKASDFETFATAMEADDDPDDIIADLSLGGLTGIGNAIDFCDDLFTGNGYTGTSQVIDVSGDGTSNTGSNPEDQRDIAEGNGITINGLSITNTQSVIDEYDDNVITSDGFHINSPASFAGFAAAVLNKLLQEVGATPEGSAFINDLCPYVQGGEARKRVTTISGLDHLEGEAIQLQMDGTVPTNAAGEVVANSFTVASGAVTLPKAAAVIHAGLPYTGKLKLLKQSSGSASGTGQTKMRRIYLAVLRLYKSLGIKIGVNDDDVSPIFDTDPTLPLFSGDQDKLPDTEHDDETEFVIKQDQPLPAFILALILRSEVEEKG